MDKSYLLSAIPPLISATLSVTFFFLWLRKKCNGHVLNWALAYTCAAIGSAIDFARILAESGLLSFVANIFFVGVAFFAVRGSILRYAGKPLDRILVPLYVLAVSGGLWFAIADPSILWRGTVNSAAAATMFLVGAVMISRSKGIDRLDRLTAVAFVVTAAILIGRPIASYIYEGPIQEEAQVADSLWIVSFKIFAILSWFATAILFLLRVTSDLMEELSAQSLTDPLTGIGNRRGFFMLADAVLRDASPALPATLLVLDIDHFKRVNDNFGHATGDRVIQSLGTLLREITGGTGCVVARIGGEEFVALLPATNLVGGWALAEGIRTAFAARSHEGIPSTSSSRKVTVSIGLAESLGGEEIDSLLERADGALYRAKREGRNRVEANSAGDAGPLDSESWCTPIRPDRRKASAA